MNDIYITSESPDGSLFCIVESDEGSVWAYLHLKEKEGVVSDAPVCSQIPLWSVNKFKENYRGVGPPPLVDRYFADEAVIPDINNERISIEWRDSNPEILIDQKVVTKIQKNENKGYSVFIQQDCPWGHPLEPKENQPLLDNA